MLDQAAIDKIHRNLKRCQAHPGKMIPAEVFQRDVSMLMADISDSFYGDLNLKTLRDDLRFKMTVMAFEVLIPDATALLRTMQLGTPQPAYVYETRVKSLLDLRWRVMSGTIDQGKVRQRDFVAAVIRNMHRRGFR